MKQTNVTPAQIALDDAGVPVLLSEAVTSAFVSLSRKKLQADRALTKRLAKAGTPRLVGIPWVTSGKRVFYTLRACRHHLEEIASGKIGKAA